jgi:hypothetical protein
MAWAVGVGLSGRVPERRLRPPTGGLGLLTLEVRVESSFGLGSNEMTAMSLQMARSRPWFDLWAPGGC